MLLLHVCASSAPTHGPTKVFFLLGQSNMEGQGIVEISEGAGSGNGTLAFAVQNKPSAGFPVCDVAQAAGRREGCVAKGANLDDLKIADGSWQTWPSVTVDYFGKIGDAWGMVHPRGALSVGFGVSAHRGVGPELGFGVTMAQHYGAETDVLLLKVAWGGTSLAKDWRPPSSVASHGGEVGWCYTNFTAHAHAALAKLTAAGTTYELGGVVWHQGWNDGCSSDMVAEYERNLANLIKDIREEFKAPQLPVSIPVSGMDSWHGRVDRRNGIIHAQYAVTQYEENKGTVGAQVSPCPPPSELCIVFPRISYCICRAHHSCLLLASFASHLTCATSLHHRRRAASSAPSTRPAARATRAITTTVMAKRTTTWGRWRASAWRRCSRRTGRSRTSTPPTPTTAAATTWSWRSSKARVG